MSSLPPPADIDAECAVIGSALIDPSVVANLPWLAAEAFTHAGYALAWQAMLELASKGSGTDVVNVGDRMRQIDPATAREYSDALYQTINATPTSANARHYALIVLRCWQQRELIAAAQTVVVEAYRGADPEHIGATSMRRISRILSVNPDHVSGRRTYRHVLADLGDDTLNRMEARERGILTGYPRIDAWTGGFEPGQLVLLAGRPASGKSALGLSIARRVAAHFCHVGAGAVDVVTMEMSMLSQARRLIASRANLDTRSIRSGFRRGADDIDTDAYAEFLMALGQDSDQVGDHLAFQEGSMTTDALAMIATEAKHQHGMRLLVIDQLDLFADTHKDETQRIGMISMSLKRLAMRLGIVIICLVQLNRATESRSGGDKRPQLSDLRQNGRLEQDADMVLGLYRPSYYYPADEEDAPAYNEWAELLTLKYRDGQAGIMTPLRFIGRSASYTDWEDDRFDPAMPPVRDMMELVDRKERGR